MSSNVKPEYSASDHPPNDLVTLLVPGTLGFYTHVEVTEVIAHKDGERTPINVFSILVAEERLRQPPSTSYFLNPQYLRLKSLKGWQFGVMRYYRSIAEAQQEFENLDKEEWTLSGESLRVPKLELMPPRFVPADTFKGVPLNQVLKNNFWNGSYVVEWVDRQKGQLQFLFGDPRKQQELSEAVRPFVPMGLASLTDRLGNFLFQLPVTVLAAKVRKSNTSGDFTVQLAWHPKAMPRPLRVSLALSHDGIVTSYAFSSIEAPQSVLAMPPALGTHEAFIWDETRHLLLAATGPSAFITTVPIKMAIIDPEPRIFGLPGEAGLVHEKVQLIAHSQMVVVGNPETDEIGGWTQKRMYSHEVASLAAERRFVQYWATVRGQGTEHERALQDIRSLINQFGEEGAWLWDPYLSTIDILNTLFYCKYSGAPLRALTGAETPPEVKSNKDDFVAAQRALFSSLQGNLRGLRLEYRAKVGQAGWSFHDRFLIFPKVQRGALAWSLGTSINSLGKQHHILQRVDDGQLIMNTFVDLWEQLNKPECLIWKVP
jgi:hypothetical protein